MNNNPKSNVVPLFLLAILCFVFSFWGFKNGSYSDLTGVFLRGTAAYNMAAAWLCGGLIVAGIGVWLWRWLDDDD